MSRFLNVACVQTCSTTDVDENIAASSAIIRKAAAKGAQFVTLPEVVNVCQRRGILAKEAARLEVEDPALSAFRELAKELKIWILVVSLLIKSKYEERLLTRSYLLNEFGSIVAHYDKIHMFDVVLSNGEAFKESES